MTINGHNKKDKQVMRKNNTRFGLFYRSNGRWTGPYGGRTFTAYSINRNPVKNTVWWLRNYVLKSRVEFRKVETA